ncbi:hypothetical protein [Rhodoferax saidenbachensis]|uniref:hypothetical protein n=1 Tax=Rhodoferax saidenbachensis TaxID=1484693 RepID=UPI0012693164|nr:hypothetical protein [Rhodoferax saidenbachensis]
MNEVEAVVPLGRQARCTHNHLANGLEPRDWQFETFVAPDFEWQMGQRRQRIVEDDAQPSEVIGESRSNLPKQLQGAECLRRMQWKDLYAGSSLTMYKLSA